MKGLSPDEQKIPCLRDNAGKALLTGQQAECYANEYIFGHLKEINNAKTYSETSTESRNARSLADAATAKNDPNASALSSAAVILDAKTQSLFRGETLRGLLLTSFGFSEFGRKADQAAKIAFLAGFVLLLAAAAGTLHAYYTPATEEVQ